MNNLMDDSILNKHQIDKISRFILSKQISSFTYFRILKDSSINVITTLKEDELLNLTSGDLLNHLLNDKNVNLLNNVAYYTVNDLSTLVFAKRCNKVHFVIIFLLGETYENLDSTARSAILGVCLSATRLMHANFRFKNDIEDQKLYSKLWHSVNYSSNQIADLGLSQKEVSLLIAIAASVSAKELSLITGYSHHYLNKMSSELSQKLGCITKFELQEIARIITLSQYFDIE
ncbi:hypothetical protein L3V82_04000 [Thiotrichales bacterium 19S3-7]|nr:hypothetical protein [Thiotrichales bacterium 19S3-7]MCF6801837.1 hypothetical protein [Thiotrichales bacterium 19S3-11]